VTTLDVVRASRFISGIVGTNPVDTPITVIGGHSGATIVPLLSQSSFGKGISGEAYNKVVNRIQYGGDEVVKAKDGAGSATLSMAYAGAKFTNALLRGLAGEKGVITPTFVKSPLFAGQGIDFFSSNVELGVSAENFDHGDRANVISSQPNGVEKIHPIGELTAEEAKLLEACLPELKKNIEKGKAFVESSP
jgi:malate dehydrogenase